MGVTPNLNAEAEKGLLARAESRSSGKASRITRGTLAVFAALLIGLGWGIGYGVAVLMLPAQPPQMTHSAIPPELELRYQLLKTQLDSADDHAKHLDRLATLLLTLTSLYALVLGLNSYFGLKQILDSGKDDLGRLREFLAESRLEVREKLQEVDTKVGAVVTRANSQFAEFSGQLREKYPELANLHGNLGDVLSEIKLMFPTARDWTTYYRGLTAEQREKILVAELRLAGLEIFRLGDLDWFRQHVREVYQGLGRFYSSKYKNEQTRSDWERASLYFDKAVRIDLANPLAELMKDLAVHLTLIEQVIDDLVIEGKMTPTEMKEVQMFRVQAEWTFRESLSAKALEAGALFGLGWVLYRKGDYPDAIAQYALVTTITVWAVGDRQKYLEDAYLNKAGCYALMAGEDRNDAAYTQALENLEQSQKIAVEFQRLPEWKLKIEREAERKDLRRLRATHPEALARLLV